MNRSELETFIEYGKRPVYGIPHISYGTNSYSAYDILQRRGLNWKKFSESILKEKAGARPEVSQIIASHFKNKERYESFLVDMSMGRKRNKESKDDLERKKLIAKNEKLR